MRKLGQSLYYITLTLICQFFLCCGAPAFATNVDNFYFDPSSSSSGDIFSRGGGR